MGNCTCTLQVDKCATQQQQQQCGPSDEAAEVRLHFTASNSSNGGSRGRSAAAEIRIDHPVFSDDGDFSGVDFSPFHLNSPLHFHVLSSSLPSHFFSSSTRNLLVTEIRVDPSLQLGHCLVHTKGLCAALENFVTSFARCSLQCRNDDAAPALSVIILSSPTAAAAAAAKVAPLSLDLSHCKLTDASATELVRLVQMTDIHLRLQSINLAHNELSIVGISKLLRTLTQLQQQQQSGINDNKKLLFRMLQTVNIAGNDASPSTARVVRSYDEQNMVRIIVVEEEEETRENDDFDAAANGEAEAELEARAEEEDQEGEEAEPRQEDHIYYSDDADNVVEVAYPPKFFEDEHHTVVAVAVEQHQQQWPQQPLHVHKFERDSATLPPPISTNTAAVKPAQHVFAEHTKEIEQVHQQEQQQQEEEEEHREEFDTRAPPLIVGPFQQQQYHHHDRPQQPEPEPHHEDPSEQQVHITAPSISQPRRRDLPLVWFYDGADDILLPVFSAAAGAGGSSTSSDAAAQLLDLLQLREEARRTFGVQVCASKELLPQMRARCVAVTSSIWAQCKAFVDIEKRARSSTPTKAMPGGVRGSSLTPRKRTPSRNERINKQQQQQQQHRSAGGVGEGGVSSVTSSSSSSFAPVFVLPSLLRQHQQQQQREASNDVALSAFDASSPSPFDTTTRQHHQQLPPPINTRADVFMNRTIAPSSAEAACIQSLNAALLRGDWRNVDTSLTELERITFSQHLEHLEGVCGLALQLVANRQYLHAFKLVASSAAAANGAAATSQQRRAGQKPYTTARSVAPKQQQQQQQQKALQEATNDGLSESHCVLQVSDEFLAINPFFQSLNKKQKEKFGALARWVISEVQRTVQGWRWEDFCDLESDDRTTQYECTLTPALRCVILRAIVNAEEIVECYESCTNIALTGMLHAVVSAANAMFLEHNTKRKLAEKHQQQLQLEAKRSLLYDPTTNNNQHKKRTAATTEVAISSSTNFALKKEEDSTTPASSSRFFAQAPSLSSTATGSAAGGAPMLRANNSNTVMTHGAPATPSSLDELRSQKRSKLHQQHQHVLNPPDPLVAQQHTREINAATAETTQEEEFPTSTMMVTSRKCSGILPSTSSSSSSNTGSNLHVGAVPIGGNGGGPTGVGPVMLKMHQMQKQLDVLKEDYHVVVHERNELRKTRDNLILPHRRQQQQQEEEEAPLVRSVAAVVPAQPRQKLQPSRGSNSKSASYYVAGKGQSLRDLHSTEQQGKGEAMPAGASTNKNTRGAPSSPDNSPMPSAANLPRPVQHPNVHFFHNNNSNNNDNGASMTNSINMHLRIVPHGGRAPHNGNDHNHNNSNYGFNDDDGFVDVENATLGSELGHNNNNNNNKKDARENRRYQEIAQTYHQQSYHRETEKEEEFVERHVDARMQELRQHVALRDARLNRPQNTAHTMGPRYGYFAHGKNDNNGGESQSASLPPQSSQVGGAVVANVTEEEEEEDVVFGDYCGEEEEELTLV